MITLNRADAARVKRVMKDRKIGSLLAQPLSNPKIAKGGKIGVLTAPMHLAPAALSGYEVCPMATAGCRAACLHTAGNPVYMAGKTRARIARTKFYFEARADFMQRLAFEIAAHVRAAARADMIAGVRLNATSDIPWEKVAVTINGITYANIMSAFPDVTFYDYTARHNRKNLPANYTLTYSLKENNDAQAKIALANGFNVAAVFGGITPKSPMRKTFSLLGRKTKVIDGDIHDFRPADKKGVIVGLRAKGMARHDKSGFVRHV